MLTTSQTSRSAEHQQMKISGLQHYNSIHCNPIIFYLYLPFPLLLTIKKNKDTLLRRKQQSCRLVNGFISAITD
jgi:hypothetical protein